MILNLFSVPISITSAPQALALIGEWLREFRDKGQRPRAKGQGPKAKGQRPRAKGICSRISLSPYPLALSPKIITTPNPEIIVAAQSDPELMKALQEADLSIPDGIGIVWALKLLRKSQLKSAKIGEHQITDKPEKVGSDLSGFSRNPISADASRSKPAFSEPIRLSGLDLMEGMILQGVSFKDRPLKVMLLGGRPGVAQAAAASLQTVKWLNGQMAKRSKRRNPNSTVQPFNHSTVSAVSGPQNISAISKSENNRLIAQINSFQPDLLFVAFGHPRQEKWLMENRERLTVGVAMAVGGALDQIADPSLRPPPYINSIGLGWLYRLLRQPWRWKRQLALLKFIGMVVKEKLKSSNSKIQMPNQFQSSKFKKI